MHAREHHYSALKLLKFGGPKESDCEGTHSNFDMSVSASDKFGQIFIEFRKARVTTVYRKYYTSLQNLIWIGI